jgi:endonuclease-3
VDFINNIETNLAKMRKIAVERKAAVLGAEDQTKGNPFKILVFTMLSARTKDATTIRVVNKLFTVANSPEKISKLNPKKLEKLLYGIGFYREKTKHLIGTCRKIERDGKVPDKLEELLELPGVGRKTANIVLARAFDQQTLGVDVHVHRISNRLGIAKTKKPEETEHELVMRIPKKYLRSLNRDFVAFGQTVCLPRNPDCKNCPIEKSCRKIGIGKIKKLR